MSVFIPAAALTGFNPADHPQLGFTYFLFDRELGQQYFSVGSEFPSPPIRACGARWSWCVRTGALLSR